MKNEATIELFLYWNRLRAGKPAPKRTQVEPSDIRSRLADTFILEALPNGLARFRLAGTRICAVFARELKGFEFDSILVDRDRMMLGRLVQAAIREATVSVIGLDGLSKNNRRNAFELILLPLTSEADGGRLLGSLVAQEKPFWLGADPIIRCEINSVRVVDPDREPVFLKNRPEVPVPPLQPSAGSLTGMGKADVFDDEIVYLSDKLPSRRFGHLRVYEGGKKHEDDA